MYGLTGNVVPGEKGSQGWNFWAFWLSSLFLYQGRQDLVAKINFILNREYCSCPSPYVRSRWSYEAADVIARIGYRDSIVFAELVAALRHGENGRIASLPL